MAEVVAVIPDGDYCADHTLLDCKFADHAPGFHFCTMFGEILGDLEDIYINNQRHCARRKCSKCRELLQNDTGKGLVPDKDKHYICIAECSEFEQNSEDRCRCTNPLRVQKEMPCCPAGFTPDWKELT